MTEEKQEIINYLENFMDILISEWDVNDITIKIKSKQGHALTVQKEFNRSEE